VRPATILIVAQEEDAQIYTTIFWGWRREEMDVEKFRK
jgi:hypothetical protein